MVGAGQDQERGRWVRWEVERGLKAKGALNVNGPC